MTPLELRWRWRRQAGVDLFGLSQGCSASRLKTPPPVTVKPPAPVTWMPPQKPVVMIVASPASSVEARVPVMKVEHRARVPGLRRPMRPSSPVFSGSPSFNCSSFRGCGLMIDRSAGLPWGPTRDILAYYAGGLIVTGGGVFNPSGCRIAPLFGPDADRRRQYYACPFRRAGAIASSSRVALNGTLR